MIIKLVKPGGVSQLIDCDEVMAQPTANHTMDVEIFKNGTRVKRVIVGEREQETAEWEVAFVMESGKTVDTIRQTTFPPKTKISNPLGGKSGMYNKQGQLSGLRG